MGLSLIGSSSRCEASVSYPADPQPKNFKIDVIHTEGIYTVVELTYPNCTNFEGNKILLFKGMSTQDILMMKEIDPHFYKNSCLVARFIPTDVGRDLVFKLLDVLVNGIK